MTLKPEPDVPRVPLLPPWLALVTAGVTTTVATQILLVGEEFTALFGVAGLELPRLTQLLVGHPLPVPLVFFCAAAAMFASPRCFVRDSARTLRQAAGAAAVLVTATACLLSFMFPIVLLEAQKALQQ